MRCSTDERKQTLRGDFVHSGHGLKEAPLHTGCGHAVLGISGGLDSTLALLVTVRAFDMLKIPRNQIHAAARMPLNHGQNNIRTPA